MKMTNQVSFTTPKGAAIVLTLDGDKINATINGAPAEVAGDALVGPGRDLLPVRYNGKDMAIQTGSAAAAVKTMLGRRQANQTAAYLSRMTAEDRVEIESEKAIEAMRRRMYSANSDC